MQTFIKKYLKFYGFYVFLFFTSLLVFFSRYLQIVFVKKNKEQFYLFEDPIFINPDAYFYLGEIKKNILENSSFFEKLFSDSFLSSLFFILHGLFNKSNILEIIILSQPYFVVITFLSIFLFFSSLSNRFIALLSSFIFILSDLFIARSSVLFFDTDIFNIFYFFSILYVVSLYFNKDLSRKNFYLCSLIILILFSLFCFHYPKPFFSILFFLILLFSFLVIEQRKLDLFVVLFFFILISLFFYGFGNLFEETLGRNRAYLAGQVIEDNKSISISSAVSELKILSIIEIEKYLFYQSFKGFFLFLSLSGIILFIKNNLKKFIFFIPFFLFSYFSLTKGMRFLIYAAPYIYFGLFYLLNFLSNKLMLTFDYKLIKKIIYLIIFILIWENSFASCKSYFKGQCIQTSNIKPYFNKNLIKGIIRINNFSENFNIISAWDYGYLIDFYSNSKFELNPAMALNKNKFDIFYSNKDINSKHIQSEFNLENQADNYIFLTNDFIKWWPTIVKLNSNEDEKTPKIIQFSCKENEERVLKCNSKTGIKTKVNLNIGTIDEKKILNKLIIHSKNKYSEKLFHSNGSVILVYTPSLEHTNLTAIFPKESEDLLFIKYFFFNNDDENIKLIDDGWPNYRTYKVN